MKAKLISPNSESKDQALRVFKFILIYYLIDFKMNKINPKSLDFHALSHRLS